MTEPLIGYLLWAAIALHRGLELVWARTNLRRLVARGGVLVRDDGFTGIFLVHAAWLVSMLLERLFLGARMIEGISGPCLAAFAGVEVLRAWTLATLGRRWTVRVVVLKGEEPVRTGPYRFLRHPNYLVVVLELLLAPMAMGAWRTAALLAVPNAVTLLRRIRLEEAAWRETAGRSLP